MGTHTEKTRVSERDLHETCTIDDIGRVEPSSVSLCVCGGIVFSFVSGHLDHRLDYSVLQP